MFLPNAVRVAWSPDGASWHEAPPATHAVPDREQRKLIHPFAVAVGATARYVRVVAANRRTCPAWHPGHGQPAWIFIDEIVVR